LAPLLSYVRSQGPCCSVFKDRVGRNRSAAARRQRLLYCAPHRHATGIFWSTAGHPPARHPARRRAAKASRAAPLGRTASQDPAASDYGLSKRV